MKILWLDFETRSRCDLRARGVYNYAQDLSTEVLCMSYAFDDDEVVTWVPGQPFPAAVANHTGQIRAHNAAFERLIFWFVLCPEHKFPEFKLEQFYCTAAQARANCAPGSLEDAGRFAGASMTKDFKGSKLIRMLSIPKPDGTFRESYYHMQQMIAYCEQDVRAMRAISKGMRELSDEELVDYHVNERVNDRGVRVDVELCRAAERYSGQELHDIQLIVQELTKGKVMAARGTALLEWVLNRVGRDAQRLMEVQRDDGEFRYSLDKTIRANLIALAGENHDEVPSEVAEVIQCADDIRSASVAKFKRAAALADDDDGRVRGSFVFAGGSATGRAASFGLQVHNFPRKCAKEPQLIRDAMARGERIAPKFGHRVNDVLKEMLRPALMADPGNKLVVADWSSIEARVNPWLSERGEDKLDIFRNGGDVYKVNASATFRVPVAEVTGSQRQIGKVQELACGFGGGLGAFASMGRIYGLVMSESDARRMVDGWRRANPWAVGFWDDLEHAYISAMRNKGKPFAAGRITYLFDGLHLWYALPSGRILSYPFARLEKDELTYAKAAWKPAADAEEWPRARLWRGLACENVTQATAADILRYALRSLDAEGFEPVLHVHDEIVLETKDPEAAEDAMRRIMCTPPEWAAGLPLGIETSIMTRYGKG